MNSLDAWTLFVDERIEKETRRFPRLDRRAISEAIRLLAFDPYFGDLEKMKGERDVWRRRIGSYRIFFKIKTEGRAILVFHVERRTTTTY